jgi:hypothetical protein
MRNFESGAVRNDDKGKPDFEGCLHPSFVIAFGDYMRDHRKQADGSVRSDDNWQKGIPKPVYMKSLLRHVVDLWAVHRGMKRCSPEDGHKLTVEELCCAILFNVQGYFFEHKKEK